jgi:hypothetical protein
LSTVRYFWLAAALDCERNRVLSIRPVTQPKGSHEFEWLGLFGCLVVWVLAWLLGRLVVWLLGWLAGWLLGCLLR